MAEYLPPTENVPIFDSALFTGDQNFLTQGSASNHFLKYPIAQGTETLLDTYVDGVFTINNSNDKITIADNNNNSSICIGTSNTASLNNLNNTVVMGCNSVVNFGNKIINDSTIIGSSCYSNRTEGVSGFQEYRNTVVGANSLYDALNDDGNTTDNTAIGYKSLSVLSNGYGNTALGSSTASFNTNILSEGSMNTFIGSNAGVITLLEGICNHSTAIGADAQISDDNQIMLGSNTDYVQIPNYIKFSDNSTLSSANALTPNLSTVLSYGNSAGAYDIEMNVKSINNLGGIQMDSGDIELGSTSNIIMNYASVIKCNDSLTSVKGLAIWVPYQVSKITFHNAGDDTPLVINNQNNISLNSAWSVIIGNDTLRNALLTDTISTSTIIGSSSLGYATFSSSRELGETTTLGYQTLMNLNINGSNLKNTAIGCESLSNLINGSQNTALGYYSGQNLVNGNYNTILGSNITIPNTTNHSTAIGQGAIITGNNQVVLGTSADTIIIPNQVKFPDNTTQNTAYNTPQSYFYTFTTTPQNISLNELRTNYNVNYTTAGVLLLRLPSSGINTTSYITVYNNNTNGYNINLGTSATTRLFKGRFGSNSTLLPLRPLNWATVAYNPSTDSWDVIDKSFVNSIEANVTPTYDATNISLCNSLLRFLTSSGSPNVYLSDTVFRPYNQNGYLYLENTSTSDITLNLVSNATFSPSTTSFWKGIYGSQTSTLILPSLTNFNIFITTSGDFLVNSITPQRVVNLTYTGIVINTYNNPQYFDTVFNLSGSNASDFYLPDPRTSVNTYSNNRSITINNNGSSVLTIYPTDGNFTGVYGSQTPYIFLSPNNYFIFFCNGTNWEINNRSPNISFNENTILSTVSYSTKQYINSTINFSSTVNTTIDLPQPVIYTTIKIYNNCQYHATLRAADFNGTATQSGVTLNVISITGVISVGSSVIFYGLILYIQPFGTGGTTGTGGIGTYIVSDFQNITVPSNFYGRNGFSSVTFNGEWGNYDSTIRLNPNSWTLLYASTTDSWDIIDRSSNQIFDTINIAASTSYAPHYNLLNSYVPFNPNNNGYTITIPNPTSVFSRNKYMKVENVSQIYSLTLSINGGTFTGTFGSASSTLIIPSNSWIYFYSDGTNWICNDVSSYGWTYPITNTGSSIAMVYQWFRYYINVSASTTFNITLPSVIPQYYQEGLQVNVRKIQGNTSATTPMTLVSNSASSGTNTLYIGYNANGSYPLTGNSLISPTNSNNMTLRVIRTSVGGGGACVVNSADARMIYLNPTTGSLSIGTVITVGGATYTIRGCGNASATVSATAGASTFTAINIATFFASFLSVGMIFTVSGSNYTITNITYSASYPAGTTYPTYTPSNVTFTPVVPAGGWTSVTLSPAVFSSYSAGLYGTGVYHLNTAVLSTGSTTYTNTPYFSWALTY